MYKQHQQNISSSVHENIFGYPVGYHDLHPDTGMNFQMNRMFNWVGDESMLAEMKQIGQHIHTYDQYVEAFLNLADKRLNAGDNLVGAFYLRAAEFFMFVDDPRKEPTRKQFLTLTREHYHISDEIYHLIPYENGKLPAYDFNVANPKDTIILFGGFDSYIEELLGIVLKMQEQGYRVIVFEGPGQGQALEEYGLKMTANWEKPVSTVLDYFGLDNVSLIGISLGGYLAIRAAAFEPRIQRVICDDILADFLDVSLKSQPVTVQHTLRLLTTLGFRPILNALLYRVMRHNLLTAWGVKQGIHVMGVSTPYDFLRKIRKFNTTEVSKLVRQDVLLLAGSEDHYVPLDQLYQQMKGLTGAKSITARMFSREEHAQNHCQIGNLNLAFNIILDWIDQYH